MKNFLIAAFTTFVSIATAQQTDTSLIAHLQNEIGYLASDKLQGRQTGSKGEKMAYQFICKQYKQIGVLPNGEKKFIQSFNFVYGKKLSGKNRLNINGTEMVVNQDYYPINFSGSGKVSGSIKDVGFGITAPQIKYDSYKNMTSLKGEIFLIECSTPDGDSPHSDYAPYSDINKKIKTAVEKGAIAIIFTNTLNNAEDLAANLDINVTLFSIPIVFVKGDVLKNALKQDLNNASIEVNLTPIEITGHNVVAFLDNGATNIVVIGAHYDHLGYGEYGNSLYTGAPAIHNGADDNASGTAGVIELARYLTNNGVKEKNNYLFINFSGEELGLVGSKYWVNHATTDTSQISYMLNMDMIGRYRVDKGIEISGLGTSPDAFNFIRDLKYDSVKIIAKETGIGPSDHSSFYLANMPVLFFFTGSHEDYHKPTDDADKINYGGEATMLHLIEDILLTLDSEGKLPFTKTADVGNSDMPSFKVRLGIVPDYLFEGPGLRVDGVNNGQPAANAGIQKGDIILALGDFAVSEIMSYMKALGEFQKGDTTTITVKRGEQTLQLKVTF